MYIVVLLRGHAPSFGEKVLTNAAMEDITKKLAVLR
jgi:hypothetical protein